ncbi:protein ACCELERATED CELL DEATH 6 [Quercus suber]|uniref:protein ACCELERATED CELL DEATH 6 n=1 Tax=Quercus suber TaxID=58331 RepID=UPI0032DFEC7F
MKTQHDDAMQEDPERHKADKWDFASILEKLRDTECSLLLERFLDSNTLLHVAASLGHDLIVEAILSKQEPEVLLAAKNSGGDLPLHVAVNAGHLPIVQQLLKSSSQCQEFLTAKNSSGDLPLHVAVNAGHLPIVQQLLKSSDQCQELLTAKNSSGDLPLHIAVNAGHLPIVQQLLKSSSCSCKLLKEENKEGITPLHRALIKKCRSYEYIYTEMADFLIETVRKAEDGELMEFVDGFGKSPPNIRLVYSRYGTSPTLSDKTPELNTVLHLAAASSVYRISIVIVCVPDILDTVLESLPNDILTVKDDKGMTPLTYAASIGYLRGVERLLRKTTMPCVYGEDTRYYPIHIATWKGHINVVEKFLDEYPDMIELNTGAGQNILHVAAMNGKAKMVAYMLKRHDLKVEMLINNKDRNGNTPLHLAAMRRHPMVVSMLTWDKRVDLTALNKEGKRALDIALNCNGRNPSFRQRLTWEALRYVSGPRAPPGRVSGENLQWSKVGMTLRTDEYKDRTGTLLLVATLVATVTFAAAFTMPGGYKESGGMAKFLEKPMFHVFVISNSIAMYSAITAVVTLIWAHLGDLNLLIAAYNFSVPFLGLAITMVSLAFMAGNYLVLRDHNWLAYLVLSIGSFFLFTLSIIFFPLCLPNSSPYPIIRYILRYPFHLLIKFSGCDADDFDEWCDTDDSEEDSEEE